MARLIIRHSIGGDEYQTATIRPRWIGQHLAVHRRIVVRDDCGGIIGQLPLEDNSVLFRPWIVTHIKTGFVAGKFYSLDYAMNAARRADKMQWKDTEKEIKSDNGLVKSWKEVVYSNLGIC
jgi:hypothetical protein